MIDTLPSVVTIGSQDEPDDSSLESDQLVVRGLARIEKINSPHSKRVSFTFTNWQISRMMRRDFHYLASSMYFANKVHSNRSGISNLLHSIERESANLIGRSQEIVADFYSEGQEPVQKRLTHTVEFRVVDRNSRSLYDAITRTDQSVSNMGGFLEPAELTSVLRDFKGAISDLTNFLLKFKKE